MQQSGFFTDHDFLQQVSKLKTNLVQQPFADLKYGEELLPKYFHTTADDTKILIIENESKSTQKRSYEDIDDIEVKKRNATREAAKRSREKKKNEELLKEVEYKNKVNENKCLKALANEVQFRFEYVLKEIINKTKISDAGHLLQQLRLNGLNYAAEKFPELQNQLSQVPVSENKTQQASSQTTSCLNMASTSNRVEFKTTARQPLIINTEVNDADCQINNFSDLFSNIDVSNFEDKKEEVIGLDLTNITPFTTNNHSIFSEEQLQQLLLEVGDFDIPSFP